MNPGELQNAYFRSTETHSLTHQAAIHNELAQRHLAKRLEEERENAQTQVKELEEGEESQALRAEDDQDGRETPLPFRRYQLKHDKGQPRPGVSITDERIDQGRRLDITI